MYKTLPNKWIRKAIFDALDGLEVDGVSIPVYDNRVTGPFDPDFYILLNAQSNEVDKGNKCEYFWESQINIDIICIYRLPGNPGSSLFIDEVVDEVRYLIQGLELDASSGLNIIKHNESYLQDLNIETDTEVVYRKLINLQLLIK